MVAVANGERQTPIAEFVRTIAQLADKVNVEVVENPNDAMPLERAVQELIRKEDATISEPNGGIIAQRGTDVNLAVPLRIDGRAQWC